MTVPATTKTPPTVSLRTTPAVPEVSAQEPRGNSVPGGRVGRGSVTGAPGVVDGLPTRLPGAPPSTLPGEQLTHPAGQALVPALDAVQPGHRGGATDARQQPD